MLLYELVRLLFDEAMPHLKPHIDLSILPGHPSKLYQPRIIRHRDGRPYCILCVYPYRTQRHRCSCNRHLRLGPHSNTHTRCIRPVGAIHRSWYEWLRRIKQFINGVS